jgi:hypothetical protein
VYVLVAAGVLTLAGGIYLSFGDLAFGLQTAAFGALALGLGGYGFVKPAFVLRLVMGRWGELHDRPPDAMKKVQEGVPVPVAVLEDAMTVQRRARVGIAGMVIGVVLAAASALAFVLDASSTVGVVFLVLAAPLGVGGLILWYRTK